MQSKSKIAVVVMGFVLAGCANTSGTQGGEGQGSIIDAATGAAIGALLFGGSRGAVTSTETTVAGYVWSQKMEEQKRQMQTATAGTDVQVSRTPDNRLKLDIPSDIAFDTGDARIKPNMQPILDSFAHSLMQNSDAYVTIVGHADNSNNDVINNPLSFDHAASTRDYLVRQGVLPQRINISGRGSHEPVVDNNTAASRAINRRVEIYVFELRTPS
jgi:outer membrane protein OmpA-like peptidoglycan-associated protein